MPGWIELYIYFLLFVCFGIRTPALSRIRHWLTISIWFAFLVRCQLSTSSKRKCRFRQAIRLFFGRYCWPVSGPFFLLSVDECHLYVCIIYILSLSNGNCNFSCLPVCSGLDPKSEKPSCLPNVRTEILFKFFNFSKMTDRSVTHHTYIRNTHTVVSSKILHESSFSRMTSAGAMQCWLHCADKPSAQWWICDNMFCWCDLTVCYFHWLATGNSFLLYYWVRLDCYRIGRNMNTDEWKKVW